MNEFGDSIISSSDIIRPITQIAENTEPINLVNWDLDWWSLAIALLSFIAGTIAAIYSYQGYKFQKISAEKLEKLIPGQISYFEVVCCLINNILDFESLFFGNNAFKKYPVRLILSVSKLPDDLVNLDKYEKDKTCYEEAFKTKIAWRNYNLFIDNLIEQVETRDENSIRVYAQYMITLSKSYVCLVQNFENVLLKKSFLTSVTSTNERIAFFLLDRFFSCIEDIPNYDLVCTDSIRANLTPTTKDQYISSSFLPNIIDVENYFDAHHTMRLSVFDTKESEVDYTKLLRNVYSDIKNGSYDYLSEYFCFSKNAKLSSIDIHYFKSAFFVFIEPVIIGLKRFEYSSLLKGTEE